MRALLSILLLFIAVDCSAQNRTIQGKVTDEKIRPIPYAIVQVKGTSNGVYTNEQGQFSITSAGMADMLIFQCTGYEQKEMLPRDFTGIVILKEKTNILSEVTISYKKKKMKTGQLGIRSKSFGDAYFAPGIENGIYFTGNHVKNGYIKNIYVYVRDKGVPTNKFRVHVYEADTSIQLPIADITDTNLIVHAIKGEEWVEIDVSNKRIPVKNGLIISMEWLDGFGNDNTMQNQGTIQFKGQVLGLTRFNGIQYTYHRNIFAPDGYKEQSKFDYLVPMIYCTYTYPKE